MPIETLSQAVTPELREWILVQAAAGCAAAELLEAMHVSGWDTAVARAALQRTLQPAAAGPMVAALPHRPAQLPGTGVPVPGMNAGSSTSTSNEM